MGAPFYPPKTRAHSFSRIDGSLQSCQSSAEKPLTRVSGFRRQQTRGSISKQIDYDESGDLLERSNCLPGIGALKQAQTNAAQAQKHDCPSRRLRNWGGRRESDSVN